jgi:hypothetical protein
MKIILYALAAIAAGAAAGPMPASSAAEPVCNAAIIAQGASAHVEGSEDWKRFNGKIPDGLAKHRAIEAWEQAIAGKCPSFSTHWSRALGQHVECEGAMGHEYCTASAVPARKLARQRTRE